MTDGGRWWEADRGFIGGTVTDFRTVVEPATPLVDRTERWGAYRVRPERSRLPVRTVCV